MLINCRSARIDLWNIFGEGRKVRREVSWFLSLSASRLCTKLREILTRLGFLFVLINVNLLKCQTSMDSDYRATKTFQAKLSFHETRNLSRRNASLRLGNQFASSELINSKAHARVGNISTIFQFPRQQSPCEHFVSVDAKLRQTCHQGFQPLTVNNLSTFLRESKLSPCIERGDWRNLFPRDENFYPPTALNVNSRSSKERFFLRN